MPAPSVVNTATLTCPFGASPATLIVLPLPRVFANNQPVANIMDDKPLLNIPTFGMCSAPSNPAVAAATSAASGVFTPAPCVPAIVAPWTPGNPTVLVGGQPIVSQVSTCTCAYGGIVTVTRPGEATVIT
jgi:hypothetical protein